MHVRRKEQADASRARLVDAAVECFSELGYERTTVAAVLDRVGMARGALYHYFPEGKRELFNAAFDAVNERFHRRRDALADLESPLARIRGGIEVFLDLCTDDEFGRILLVDAPRLVPGQAGTGSTYELLCVQVEQAVVAGELQPVDPQVTAMALYGAIRSAGELVATADDREGARREAQRVLNVLVNGLASEPLDDR